MELTSTRPIVIRSKLKLINGKFASKKNMDKIFAISSQLCTHVHAYGIDPKTYYEKWTIRKDHTGFSFREVTHNGGICGSWPTVRELVMHSSHFDHIKIIFQP